MTFLHGPKALEQSREACLFQHSVKAAPYGCEPQLAAKNQALATAKAVTEAANRELEAFSSPSPMTFARRSEASMASVKFWMRSIRKSWMKQAATI